ncbi:hypothetical protein Aru02nite_31050 [Actinocatenispora rupis]|uniref:HTH cro/C1-type domain-containing protein n=2 Tax=Actinocatenispora rupis TaxID=519421 RepID=A0A8J3NAK9_9ACTN|nr:helix-turn-helix domain-containing protein [Actinocatenispora rupis]GID12216.1 hypothetical protein Aru02nite_31050 [Actinocatenispora rupis]
MVAADESVGRLISRRRQELGLSQAALARRLAADSGRSLSRKRVSDWEHERVIVGPSWLPFLAAVLDVSVSTLAAAAAVARYRDRFGD